MFEHSANVRTANFRLAVRVKALREASSLLLVDKVLIALPKSLMVLSLQSCRPAEIALHNSAAVDHSISGMPMQTAAPVYVDMSTDAEI